MTGRVARHVPTGLSGNAYERGCLQARLWPQSANDVRLAVSGRLRLASATFDRAEVRRYLEGQYAFAQRHCAHAIDEMTGIAHGFGIAPQSLFDYLHLGTVQDMEAADGCSAVALGATDRGAVVAKNRDFRGEHTRLQQVFLHSDPEWPRQVLCVGSLGSPGAYSSGINDHGLALADTAIACSVHTVGWLRYFLMTELLARFTDVGAAVAWLRSVPHAGGGSLVLADAQGHVAAIELGAKGVCIDYGAADRVARTNHFICGAEAVESQIKDPPLQNSIGRLHHLGSLLDKLPIELAALQTIFASHDSESRTGLCRHGQNGDAQTLSHSQYLCQERLLRFWPGNPCSTDRTDYGFD